MSNLKLAKLPNRNPVRVTVAIPPELYQRLEGYAAAYAETYQTQEPIAELVPAMLAAFLDSDRAFSRRKGHER